MYNWSSELHVQSYLDILGCITYVLEPVLSGFTFHGRAIETSTRVLQLLLGPQFQNYVNDVNVHIKHSSR